MVCGCIALLPCLRSVRFSFLLCSYLLVFGIFGFVWFCRALSPMQEQNRCVSLEGFTYADPVLCATSLVVRCSSTNNTVYFSIQPGLSFEKAS